jgi:6-pyruvoyl-tetrahydropterin synthase
MAKIFVDKLVNLDFTHFDPQRGLVGETLLVDFTLSGTQDDQGMVLDFALIKRQVVAALEDVVDHKLVFATAAGSSSTICVTEDVEHAGNSTITLQDSQYIYTLSMPKTGFSALPIDTITPDTIANYLTDYLHKQAWWQTHWVCTLSLYPEPIAPHEPFFHYTHGLSKHEGACQRIAHGHRSKLMIFHDEAPNPAAAQQWCDHWKDIYIASQQDLRESLSIRQVAYYRFAYTSNEGFFSLTIPQARTYLMEPETTIENIAQHLANQALIDLRECTGNQHGEPFTIRTKVYEGYNKGAIGIATSELN